MLILVNMPAKIDCFFYRRIINIEEVIFIERNESYTCLCKQNNRIYSCQQINNIHLLDVGSCIKNRCFPFIDDGIP